ncbi:unnamed protein product [Nippostrongylus brasiliensis]|uniref:ShKT domain-containing protein n=1 Tax=Nippostrongylus brasiliensis TaxID=27835 RepID=A0A0N4XIF9_NIPBR|nr:unnamed protein product [Nippostrongylus brasiliensis]
MFLLFVLALSWTLTRAQFYSCLNGGTGPCINGQCVDATQQCINTTAGEICCEISQIVSESTSVTTPATACVDQLNPKTGRSDCPSRANLCSNAIYRSIMESQCPRTCGFCTIGGTTQPQPGATGKQLVCCFL